MSQPVRDNVYRLPGFSRPVWQAQQVFRALLDAQSHPGRVLAVEAAPTREPIHAAAMAVLLTLADRDTPLWLDATADTAALREHLRFHCGCPLVDDPRSAGFALVADALAMPALSAFAQGSDEYPDSSATVIVQVAGLTVDEAGWRLTGPGIPTSRRLRVDGLPADFTGELRRNHDQFPRGVDLFLTHADCLVALPRTTRVDEA